MINESHIASLITDCKTFEQFSDTERFALASIGEPIFIPAKKMVFDMREDSNKYFYIVYSGKLLLQLRTNQTREYVRGELFGEVAIFTEDYRMGKVTAMEDAYLIAFDKEKLFDHSCLPAEVGLQVTKCLTAGIIKYLYGYLIDRVNIPIKVLIEEGEGETVEFKSTPSKENIPRIVQSIGAFMNNKGGTILIGINDAGYVHGLSANNGTDLEKQGLKISQDLRAKLVDNSHIDLVSIDHTEKIGEKRLIRIDVAASSHPVFFQHKGRGNVKKELFYLRIGAENQKLEKVSQIVKALRNRDNRNTHFLNKQSGM